MGKEHRQSKDKRKHLMGRRRLGNWLATTQRSDSVGKEDRKGWRIESTFFFFLFFFPCETMQVQKSWMVLASDRKDFDWPRRLHRFILAFDFIVGGLRTCVSPEDYIHQRLLTLEFKTTRNYHSFSNLKIFHSNFKLNYAHHQRLQRVMQKRSAIMLS